MSVDQSDAAALYGVGGEKYASAVRRFDPGEALEMLFSKESRMVNAAEICCDRHAEDPDQVALRHLGTDGQRSDWTFQELRLESERVARLLTSLGISKGDRVAALLPRTSELLITILATWRLGAVYQPLFTAFGPKAIEYRLAEAGTKLVVTHSAQREKLANIADLIILNLDNTEGDKSFWTDVGEPGRFDIPVPCNADDPFLIMFTSGTTGSAKPLLVPLRAIACFTRYMTDAIDLQPDDIFWNMADPGWAYGLYYAIIGPLALGFATTFNQLPFAVDNTITIIQKLRVNNLAGSPTAYRLIMGAPVRETATLRGRLRAVSSAGEPLNPEIVRWFDRELAAPIYDHYGQTEIGMVLCNHHGLPHSVRVGSAGFASPGHRLVILSKDLTELPDGEPGMLAMDRTASPLMWFQGYLGRETAAFAGDYYLTGDTCERNDDGSISFVGRSDDVITTSGYRVGPFDVESALLEHPAVLESAVIGKPDPERTEIIKAFIVLNEGFGRSPALAEELQNFVKNRLAAHAYPREVAFVDELPKTPSGKVQRFLLRNQEKTNSQT